MAPTVHPNTATVTDQARRAELSCMRMRPLCMNNSETVAVVLNMQSKAYAKAQGVPATWSQEDQGYIARWYSYYSAETCCNDEAIRSAIRNTPCHLYFFY